MKSRTLMMMAIGVAGAMTLAAATSEAQTVRTYGDDGGGTTSGAQVHVPGAPVPQQQAQESPAPREGDGESSDDRPVGSYNIRMYGTAGAQARQERTREVLARDHTELYRGIIPGKRDDIPHLERAKKDGERTDRPNPLTWVGFQPEETRTRIFFQSPRTMQYRLQESREGDNLIVIFDNASISTRNFSRFIDTSYFDRSIQRIEAAETRDGNVRVTLTMRDDVRPSVSTDGQYLYVDFPHQEREDDER